MRWFVVVVAADGQVKRYGYGYEFEKGWLNEQ